MKKCIKWDYKTTNDNYNICPICGENLQINKDKRMYTIGMSAEADCYIEIELTKDEAKLINTISEKLDEAKGKYCPTLWIDYND
jgi:transcription initiation factor IIE alpha subunit